jgi:hypothetical protein
VLLLRLVERLPSEEVRGGSLVELDMHTHTELTACTHHLPLDDLSLLLFFGRSRGRQGPASGRGIFQLRASVALLLQATMGALLAAGLTVGDHHLQQPSLALIRYPATRL